MPLHGYLAVPALTDFVLPARVAGARPRDIAGPTGEAPLRGETLPAPLTADPVLPSAGTSCIRLRSRHRCGRCRHAGAGGCLGVATGLQMALRLGQVLLGVHTGSVQARSERSRDEGFRGGRDPKDFCGTGPSRQCPPTGTGCQEDEDGGPVPDVARMVTRRRRGSLRATRRMLVAPRTRIGPARADVCGSPCLQGSRERDWTNAGGEAEASPPASGACANTRSACCP